ncbi:E3 ubiquitin-protein ligase TRIM11-like [Gastrophryne carolinensis]
MASADLRKELECSICLSLYTDPVILTCGHNFCRECISRVLDTQEASGVYSCPDCREEFLKKPSFQRNLALRNIVENLRSTRTDQEEAEVFCTYCIHFPVPAVKSCLMCEASLCVNHVNIHSKSPEHVLLDPTTSMENIKCPVHNKILEYYCSKDAACICVSCCLVGEHRGHPMEPLQKAFEETMTKLQNTLQELKNQQETIKENVQRLQVQQSNLKAQEACETQKVTNLLGDLRRQLEDLEKKVSSKISEQAEKASLSVSDTIQELEINMGKLSSKVLEIEALCKLTEPLTVLQKSGIKDLCDEGGKRYNVQFFNVGDLDVTWVSRTLYICLRNILKGVNVGVYNLGRADITLDEVTANNNLSLSSDRRTASRSYENRQITEKRFQDVPQVLSSQTFSSGQHYWEVHLGSSNNWKVGVCYPSIAREGDESEIGSNDMSWCLARRVQQTPNPSRQVTYNIEVPQAP